MKVQRPGLETSLLSDLDVLVELSGWVDAMVPRYRRSMVHRLAEEYATRARAELDFRAEAQAIEDFHDVLASFPELCAPAVHRDLSTSRVLVMEWREGTKLDTVATPADLAALGFDPKSFARSLLRLQVSMSYEHGFGHGDTHAGNLISAFLSGKYWYSDPTLTPARLATSEVVVRSKPLRSKTWPVASTIASTVALERACRGARPRLPLPTGDRVTDGGGRTERGRRPPGGERRAQVPPGAAGDHSPVWKTKG